MSITVTEILGTDSISASRLVINDNFNVLKDEINSIETYLDPTAGTIDGLYNLQTAAIKVGPNNAPFLEITPTVFNINANVVIKNKLSIDGILAINKTIQITDSITLSNITADTYVVSQTNGNDINIAIAGGLIPGQEITFVCSQHDISGNIIIKPQINHNFGFDSSGVNALSEIVLNNVGSSVKLKYIEETSGVYVLYIIGGYNFNVQ